MNKIQLTKEQIGQIAAGVLFGALFVYVYTVYFWVPIANGIEANSKANAAMENDIATARALKAKCPDLEATLAARKEEKEAVQQRLPDARQFPDLIKTLTALSAEHNVSLRSINPGGNTPGEYFIKSSYQVIASGNYHSLGRFLAALGLEVRIMTVENLVLAGTPGGDTSASATFTLVTYQYNGSPRPASATPRKTAR
jgi:type IV pilus assembly protein PilO